MSRAVVSRGLSVYIHWPYCLKACSYCDFNKYVSPSVDQQRIKDAFVKTIRHQLARVPHHTVTSIYFGGGTPSLAPTSTVASIIEAIASSKRIDTNCEVGFKLIGLIVLLLLLFVKSESTYALIISYQVTLECNPTSSSEVKFQELRYAGVNRISVRIL